MSVIFAVVSDDMVSFRGTRADCRNYVTKNNLSKYLILPLSHTAGVRNTPTPAARDKKIEKSMGQWYWNRLPKNLHSKVKHCIDTHQYTQLLRYHNQYKLSDMIFCCGDAVTVTLFNAYRLQKIKGTFDDSDDDDQDGS